MADEPLLVGEGAGRSAADLASAGSDPGRWPLSRRLAHARCLGSGRGAWTGGFSGAHPPVGGPDLQLLDRAHGVALGDRANRCRPGFLDLARLCVRRLPAPHLSSTLGDAGPSPVAGSAVGRGVADLVLSA